MTSEKFGANLRSIIASAGLWWPKGDSSSKDFPHRVWYLQSGIDMSWNFFNALYRGMIDPTPEDVETLAAALKCPVERLTVSREDIENELLSCKELLRHSGQVVLNVKREAEESTADYDRRVVEGMRWEKRAEAAEAERDALAVRVQELESERDGLLGHVTSLYALERVPEALREALSDFDGSHSRDGEQLYQDVEAIESGDWWMNESGAGG
jgi:hypothetical protein